ncbi:MAG: hypothetical protein ACKV2U_09655 [Bryobacteraceae bacterium]
MDHVVAGASAELSLIEKNLTEGAYDSLEEYESAENSPFGRIEIASRAIGQELANLIEYELHEAATVPWLHSRHKGPKTLLDLGETGDPTRLKMVSDLNMKDAIALIEGYYGVVLAEIDGWDDVNRLRETVNSFKHRNGVKHWRDCGWGENGFRFPQFEEFGSVEAYEAMDTVERFLIAFDHAVENKCPDAKQAY